MSLIPQIKKIPASRFVDVFAGIFYSHALAAIYHQFRSVNLPRAFSFRLSILVDMIFQRAYGPKD
jgi:hypothetical protein